MLRLVVIIDTFLNNSVLFPFSLKKERILFSVLLISVCAVLNEVAVNNKSAHPSCAAVFRNTLYICLAQERDSLARAE